MLGTGRQISTLLCESLPLARVTCMYMLIIICYKCSAGRPVLRLPLRKPTLDYRRLAISMASFTALATPGTYVHTYLPYLLVCTSCEASPLTFENEL